MPSEKSRALVTAVTITLVLGVLAAPEPAQAAEAWFEGSISGDYAAGCGFAADSSVAVEVKDASAGSTLASDSASTDGDGCFVIEFDGFDAPNVDLLPGMFVSVSDGTATKELTLVTLSIDGIDTLNDTAWGTAPPDTTFNVDTDVCPSGCGDFVSAYPVVSDGGGAWIADFGALGVDLVPGNDLGANIGDDDGDQTIFDLFVPDNQAPFADAGGPYTVAEGAETGFDGTASSDPDGDPLRYDWDWSDSAASSDAGATPTHAYEAAGIYDVCLTVTDPAGESSTACTYAVVYDPDDGFVTGGGWIDSPAGAYYPPDLPFFDGSYYDIFFSEEPLHFFDARDLVAGMSCERCESSHLATITSQAEYDTALGLFDEFGGVVLGGYQDEAVSPPDAGWQWVTGEPFDFDATLDWWLPGEPNDCGPAVPDECVPGSEQVLEMYSDPEGWNDVPFYEPRNVFMVEYEDCDPGPTGKATFGFVSKYKKGAHTPTGNTEFRFSAADLNFHSTSYQWLVVTGSDHAKFKGEGTINGAGDYKFMIWAGDDDPDTFRIRIWTEDDAGNETVVYDNGVDQAIGAGSIVIHTKGK
jgi:PKD repeat protein